MRNRWLLGLAAVPLVLGSALPPAAGADTAGVTALYECPHITHITIVPNTPIHGYPCTGPLGVSPAGTAVDTSNGKQYHCQAFEGRLVDGGVWLFGNSCTV